MPARLIILKTEIKPDDARDAKHQREVFFDLLTRQFGIAIVIEKTFFRGEKRAETIHRNGAAFQHLFAAIFAHPQMVEKPPAELRIIFIAVIGIAPTIETPMRTRDLALAIDHEDGTGIARPAVINGKRHDLHPPPAGKSCLGFFSGTADHGDRLELRNAARHPRIGRARLRQLLTPYLAPAWPLHPAAFMRLPLGGHEKAVISGGPRYRHGQLLQSFIVME